MLSWAGAPGSGRTMGGHDAPPSGGRGREGVGAGRVLDEEERLLARAECRARASPPRTRRAATPSPATRRGRPSSPAGRRPSRGRSGRRARPRRPTRGAGACRSARPPSSGSPGRTRPSRRWRGSRAGSRGRPPCPCARGRRSPAGRRGRGGSAPGAGRPVPPSQWVRIGTPVRRVGGRRGGEGLLLQRRQPVGVAGDLDDPGAVRRPPHHGPGVVEGIDALLDVGDEEVGDLVRRRGARSSGGRGSSARGGGRSGRSRGRRSPG